MTKKKTNTKVAPHTELEARFINVDIKKLKARLKRIGATDLGEDTLEEIVFFDKDLNWQASKKTMVRLRKTKKSIHLAYKHVENDSIDGTEEIEFDVSDMDKAEMFLERCGLVPYCYQHKKRHTYILGKAIIDIDTWPKVPPYVEIEGDTEEIIKQAAIDLGLDWEHALFDSPRNLLAKHYDIHMERLRVFTFERVSYTEIKRDK